jgi:exosome complex component RRP4
MRKIVVPGEAVTAERKRPGSHVFTREGKICSDCLGLVNEKSDSVSVIPLEGPYVPQQNDVIIGIVVSEMFSGYSINIKSYSRSFLPKRDLDFFLKSGDVVSVKVSSVNEVNEVDVAYPRQLAGGEIMDISPVKIPRIIGKEGSMLTVLKQGTGSLIVAGRNGRVWVKGGNLKLLKDTIRLIERDAHLEHLTDKVTKFLQENAAQGAQEKEEKGVND